MDDIHHSLDHLNCVSVTLHFGQCFLIDAMFR
jgi:hypothetical protein